MDQGKTGAGYLTGIPLPDAQDSIGAPTVREGLAAMTLNRAVEDLVTARTDRHADDRRTGGVDDVKAHYISYGCRNRRRSKTSASYVGARR